MVTCIVAAASAGNQQAPLAQMEKHRRPQEGIDKPPSLNWTKQDDLPGKDPGVVPLLGDNPGSDDWTGWYQDESYSKDCVWVHAL